jgi:hypothetical protein
MRINAFNFINIYKMHLGFKPVADFVTKKNKKWFSQCDYYYEFDFTIVFSHVLSELFIKIQNRDPTNLYVWPLGWLFFSLFFLDWGDGLKFWMLSVHIRYSRRCWFLRTIFFTRFHQKLGGHIVKKQGHEWWIWQSMIFLEKWKYENQTISTKICFDFLFGLYFVRWGSVEHKFKGDFCMDCNNFRPFNLSIWCLYILFNSNQARNLQKNWSARWLRI